MSVLVLDAGNSIIKAKIARREHGETSFPHALRQLTESENQKILTRAKTNGTRKDYVRVNGTPYVVGESAERHGVISQRTGAARYTRDYYGVLAATALAQLYGRGREVALFGSHAPGDVKFREDLMRSVVGDRKTHFKVIYANTGNFHCTHFTTSASRCNIITGIKSMGRSSQIPLLRTPYTRTP